jgi:hypothetical protein
MAGTMHLCFKVGKNYIRVHEMHKTAFGDNAMERKHLSRFIDSKIENFS